MGKRLQGNRDLDLTFEIAETKVVSPDWASLRSALKGSITILANGAQIPSSNHELFVLPKTQGRWKLARYSFSSVLPAASIVYPLVDLAGRARQVTAASF